jgi:hypothetical protein
VFHIFADDFLWDALQFSDFRFERIAWAIDVVAD